MDLVYVFQNYKISKTITTHPNGRFINITGFVTVCDSSGNYNYVVDYQTFLDPNYGRIIRLNANWQYLNFIKIYNPVSMIAFNKNNTIILVITSRYGIYTYDKNMNIINSYNNFSIQYSKMYYNSLIDQLYVLSYTYSRIDVYNHALGFIKSIELPNKPCDIDAFNGSIYAVTESSSLVYVIQNDTLNKTIATTHTWIYSILVDNYGQYSILDFNRSIYVYHVNGSYSGVSWNIIPDVIEMSFDSHGDLVLVTSNGLFIMTNSSINIHISGIMADTVCIANSKGLRIFNFYA